MKTTFRNPIVISIIALTVIIALSLATKLFSSHDFSYETICAVIGVILTAVVTGVLLNGQTKQEEIKEKKSKRYEKKLQIYQTFLQKLCDVIKDRKITDEEVVELYFQVSYLAMHSEAANVKRISESIKTIVEQKSDAVDFIGPLFEIVKILKSELYESSGNDELDSTLLEEAMSNFVSISVASEDTVESQSIYDRILALKKAAAHKLGCNRQWVYNYHTLVHECYVHETSISCDTVFESDGSVKVILFLRNRDIAQFRSILGDKEIWGDLLNVFNTGDNEMISACCLVYKTVPAHETDTANLLNILTEICGKMKRYQSKVK